MNPIKLFPATEIKVMTMRESPVPEQPFSEPFRVLEFWQANVVQAPWYQPEQEQLVAYALDSKLRLKSYYLISIGLLNQTLAHSREVYRGAILLAAAHVLLVHNHPSGDPCPSADDIRCTREIAKGGQILGIPLIDHVIVGEKTSNHPRGFVSLKELGLMTE